MNSIKKEIVKELSKLQELKNLQLENTIEIPPDKNFGDLSLPCFILSKVYKIPPNQVAKQLSQKIKKPRGVSQIKVVGPYINFYIDKQFQVIQTLTKKPDKKELNLGKQKKIMIEFSSPNTNKPQHLGHLRNNLLGQSISNLLLKTNYKVIKTSIINDRGIHISKSMLAYKLWGKNKKPDKKPDHFVGDFYVLYEKKSQNNPKLDQKLKEILIKYEKGDAQTILLWKKLNSWVYQGFKQTYKDFNINFDKVYYESKIYKEAKYIVYKSLKQGTLKEKDGAIVADLSKYNLPQRILIRSDQTSLYITQDIYLALLRCKQYNPQKIIYVVANEQDTHFKQLFAILDLIGYPNYSKRLYHLSYGYISLPHGRMKSRQGIVVDTDTLLNDLIKLAKIELQKRQNLQKQALEKKAKIIAISAIRVFFLKYDPATDFVFDPKTSISFEGETGPYVLYTYARINSILRKQHAIPKKIKYSLLVQPEEQELISHLTNLNDTILKASKELKPSHVIRYIIILSQKTNEFYQKHQVLKAPQELKFARLALLKKIKQTLKETFDLMSIQYLEEM